MEWADAETGEPHQNSTSSFDGVQAIRVKSIRDIVTLYRRKREAKSLGPDGSMCARESKGLLHRRSVRDITIRHIGKEANEIEGLVAGFVAADDVTQTLVQDSRGIYPQLILPALRVAGDYFLIAQAHALGHTVVTHERPAPNAVKKIKIPDVCNGLNVPYINTPTMLRREGARFVLG